jgi:hypothetical protein
MQLHHQPILDAHPRHLHQHVPSELRGVIGSGLPAQRALEYCIGFVRP